MTIDNELIDNLLKDYKKPEDIIGENGLLKQLTKQLLERAMAAELTDHVGYEKHDTAGHNLRTVCGESHFSVANAYPENMKELFYFHRSATALLPRLLR
jgi:hypothetical protein